VLLPAVPAAGSADRYETPWRSSCWPTPSTGSVRYRGADSARWPIGVPNSCAREGPTRPIGDDVSSRLVAPGGSRLSANRVRAKRHAIVGTKSRIFAPRNSMTSSHAKRRITSELTRSPNSAVSHRVTCWSSSDPADVDTAMMAHPGLRLAYPEIEPRLDRTRHHPIRMVPTHLDASDPGRRGSESCRPRRGISAHCSSRTEPHRSTSLRRPARSKEDYGGTDQQR
jgi:hypothetical protein